MLDDLRSGYGRESDAEIERDGQRPEVGHVSVAAIATLHEPEYFGAVRGPLTTSRTKGQRWSCGELGGAI